MNFSLADQGFGYSGSYATIGAKTRLGEDIFDGRWLFEGRGHLGLESGGFFANLGVERVFTLESAGADLVLGGWFDYDGDEQGDFAHPFQLLSVNAQIKTRYWDLISNGYFPIGNDEFTQGDPTGVECFYQNYIVLQAGIDSALTGFDTLFRFRPDALAMVNGSVALGGYGYGSDVVDSFAGVRGRVGFQLLRGMTVVGELNHDNRFDLTGVVQLGWQFGGTARGNEYAGLGRDLEPTIRNDHIVRYQQDVVYAIDPDTGRPYNVYHVDNTADVAYGNGTVETPFATLLDAENASAADDIIFVQEGDGTTHGMDRGIVLKDGQLLLGDGVRHLIPIQNGQYHILCNDLDGNRPRITNVGGNDVVTLANRNTVRGLVILGNGTAGNGISGNAFPAGPPITDGIIEDNFISGAILHGVSLNTIAGDWTFARNEIRENGFDGINIVDACDPASTFLFEDNVVNANGRDGIHFENYDGTSFTFLRNTTSFNGRDGVRMEGFKNTSGNGADFLFASHIASGNAGDGIHIEDANGDLRIVNSIFQGNSGDGIELTNFTNTVGNDRTLIGPVSAGSVSTITGNSVGINIQLTDPFAEQNVTITGSTIDGNGTGIQALASGTGVNLTTNVVDNFSVSNNTGTGMRFLSQQGALHNVLVENTEFALAANNNGSVAGSGIDFLVGDNNFGQAARLAATVRNVSINNAGSSPTGSGITVGVQDDGQLDLFVQSTTINSAAGSAVAMLFDTNNIQQVSRVVFDSVLLQTPGANAVAMSVDTDSWVDFQLTNSSLVGAGGPNNSGMFITIDGNSNTLTRLTIQNNSITNFQGNGINLQTAGDTRTVADISANLISQNGPGTDINNLPYFDGVSIAVAGTSSLNARLENNLFDDNFESSLTVQTLNNAVANILLVGNNMGSDFGEDQPPAQTSNLQDMAIVNGPAGTICLAMSNNTFQWPAFVVNNAGAASYTLELDGLTNGLGVPVIIGAVTPASYGTVCEPAIAAEEAFFISSGFDP